MNRSDRNLERQKGAVSTLAISGSIVAAVIAGAVMHRCLCTTPVVALGSIQSVHDIGKGRALRPADRVKEDTTELARPDEAELADGEGEGARGEGTLNDGEDGVAGDGADGTSRPKLVPLKEVKARAGKNGKLESGDRARALRVKAAAFAVVGHPVDVCSA